MNRNGKVAAWLVVVASLAFGGCGDAGNGELDDGAAADSAAADTMPRPRTGMRGFRRPDSTRRAGTLGPVSEGAVILAALDEWSVTVSEPAVDMGQVTIAVENRGDRVHALEISSEYRGRWRSAPIAPGGSIRMSMLLSNGTYRVYCPLEDESGAHSARGMETQLVVR